MAGFKTHLTFSSILGIGYGVSAYTLFDMPIPTCILASGMCSISGMLPDIDSDSGRPLQESLAFAAAVVPMFLLGRLQDLNLSHEFLILIGAAAYLFVRFGLGYLLKHYTVHRGMFHSLPAAVVFGELAFLISSGENINIRIYKASAVVLGYVSHLLLDELYSIEWSRGRLRLKKSFGSAMKLFGESGWANFSVYGKLFLLGVLIFFDPQPRRIYQQQNDSQPSSVQQTATQIIDKIFRR